MRGLLVAVMRVKVWKQAGSSRSSSRENIRDENDAAKRIRLLEFELGIRVCRSLVIQIQRSSTIFDGFLANQFVYFPARINRDFVDDVRENEQS